MKWGPPSDVVQMPDGAVYRWNYIGGTTAYVSYGVAHARTAHCSEWLNVNPDGVIVSWGWRGQC